MSYEKQVWSKYDDLKPEEENIETGAVVTDSRMNHMEEGIEDSSSTLENHIANKVNPHAVTKTQVGLGNVDNIEQAAKTDFDAHVANTYNPHGVTKDQIGLNKVTNVEQASKSDFDNHVANKSNPHSMTAEQVNAYTKTEVTALIADAIKQAKIAVYPIGSIYTTVSKSNPYVFFGGTWERFAQGKTLVGVDENDDDFNEANKTGGEKEHTLTIDEMPSHTHSVPRTANSGSSDYNGQKIVGAPYNSSFYPSSAITAATGGSKAHNNMQPYVTVYFWRRVS